MGMSAQLATRWPDGARAALALTFDFDAEEVWIADDPANATRPGVLSQGVYGAKVAVPLILDLLARHEVAATFFVPGRVAEHYPTRVKEIVAAGHELAHHGYTHTAPTKLSREEEEEELRRGRKVLEGFCVEIAGYRSPAWEFSASTLDLLAAHGFRYSSNLMDDIRPYTHPVGLVELPVQWLLDDAAHFWFSLADWNRKISLPREVREMWLEELGAIADLGGVGVLTMHPQIIGRPSRLKLLEDVIRWAKERGDIWIARCAEIADHARTEECA
jgi:peptidoglycan/xylan/chitin deacetylase (PgdA/CDA1 family)